MPLGTNTLLSNILPPCHPGSGHKWDSATNICIRVSLIIEIIEMVEYRKEPRQLSFSNKQRCPKNVMAPFSKSLVSKVVAVVPFLTSKGFVIAVLYFWTTQTSTSWFENWFTGHSLVLEGKFSCGFVCSRSLFINHIQRCGFTDIWIFHRCFQNSKHPNIAF